MFLHQKEVDSEVIKTVSKLKLQRTLTALQGGPTKPSYGGGLNKKDFTK